MAGLVPAIHGLARGAQNVDARDKPGHDDFTAKFLQRKQCPSYCAWGCFRTFGWEGLGPLRLPAASAHRR
ncbi:MAG: hypothetical protein EKK33_09665 [Bradyrhizobiaceae bacterium]|nr:MAG: hypothetical protein EKK33_09665 [Bradyrhizobiaceae bacterium]